MDRAPRSPGPATASPDEVARFTAMAEAWWDPDGKFRPLHRFNPVRLDFLRGRLAAHFGRDPEAERPLAGLTVLDVGSGGGLLAEPLSAMGATVTGIDAGEKNVLVARAHAERSGAPVTYRHAVPEDLARAGEAFDVVLNMEIVEHVADLEAFLDASCALARPGGAMVFATLNRTLKSLALGKVGAEYVLRWLPAGTHDWRKFVRPSELARHLRRHGVTVTDLAGMSYDPFRDAWSLSRDLDVNYLAFAAKGQG